MVTILAMLVATYIKREIDRILPLSANAIRQEYLFSCRINEIAVKIIPNTLRTKPIYLICSIRFNNFCLCSASISIEAA